MCLRFVFLLITRVASWLRLSRREEAWQAAEMRLYETHHNQHRPHRSLDGAAPLKPPPEPVDLAKYRVRKHARVGGTINEYRLDA